MKQYHLTSSAEMALIRAEKGDLTQLHKHIKIYQATLQRLSLHKGTESEQWANSVATYYKWCLDQLKGFQNKLYSKVGIKHGKTTNSRIGRNGKGRNRRKHS